MTVNGEGDVVKRWNVFPQVLEEGGKFNRVRVPYGVWNVDRSPGTNRTPVSFKSRRQKDSVPSGISNLMQDVDTAFGNTRLTRGSFATQSFKIARFVITSLRLRARTWSRCCRMYTASMSLNTPPQIDPDLVQQAIAQFGNDQIVVGIDGKDGRVAISGWLEESDVTMATLMSSMVAFGVVNFVVTDITKDGTLSGPNTAQLTELQKKFPDAVVIASGGVTTVEDLKTLADNGIKAAIVGRAMATGDLPLDTLAEVATDVS